MTQEKILILDIETNSVDAQTAEFRFVGVYSYIHKKYFFLSNLQELQKLINEHKYIVTFNGKKFDNPILQRYGINMKYKIQIDLANIIQPKEFYKGKARCKIIKTSKGLMSDNLISYSLDSISRFLDVCEKKTIDFDYNILKKKVFTEKELRYIKDYTLQDVKVTKKLYEWLENHFEKFKFLLTDEQIRKKQYLTTSVGSYAYKVICNKAGLKEEYGQGESTYPGAFVAVPSQETANGKIICLDFRSAYPHAFFMCNLYSHSSIPGFKNTDLFELSGNYNDKKLGKIEKAIKELLNLRFELNDKKDPGEYAIKIVLNTTYGISGSPLFKSIYNEHTSSDCTLIVREWIKFARKMFKKAGFNVLYTDTDSAYVLIPDNKTLTQLLKIKDEIITKIKANVSFPTETFDMTIDEKISYMQFFRDKDGKLLKKNYLYLTEDGKIKIKGLPIIKSNSSKLSKVIFKRIKNEIKKNKNCKFTFEQIQSMVYQELNKDISLATRLYRVRHWKSYKKDSQLQAQISKKYGPGNHFLLKNRKIGVGKALKYCTVEESKELSHSDIDLTQTWKELSPFITDPENRITKSGEINSCLYDYYQQQTSAA